jgi:thiamine-phosphate pyrophosphorylase
MPDNLATHLRLMLVTEDRLVGERDPVALCQAAVRGGVTMVQLRLKRATGRELLALAQALRLALPVPVLVNDRPDVAVAGGTGVHLGPDDVPVALARRVLGAEAVIGASVGTESEVPRGAGADYWGVGPWRVTGTKLDAGAAIGQAGFQRIVVLAAGRPCIAIGGVRPEDVPVVRGAGGAGVAVVSGILGASDVESAARQYAQAWGG